MKTNSIFNEYLYEVSAAYTFKHGSSLRAIYAHHHDERWYAGNDYPPNRTWYNMAGIEYSILINDQKISKFPIDISLESAYFFNKYIGDYGEGSDEQERKAHTINVGFTASHDFKFFNLINVIPSISGNILKHIRVPLPGMESGSGMETACLSAKVIAKYKFLYAFAQYDKQYNPYDCTSLYSVYNIGWHSGLGLIITI